MFKYIVLLATAFVMAVASSSATAATDFDPPITDSASYDDDTFFAGNGADDHPLNVEDWPEDPFFSRIQDDPYPFALMATGLNQDPFYLDPGFYAGRIISDRFGASNGDKANKYGRKTIRLSNGFVLTVALSPKYAAMSDPSTAAAWNIGMIRYSETGIRWTWINAAPEFTDSNKYYYIYPNDDVFNDNGSFVEINDVKEYKGFIYVLATHRVAAGHTNVRLVKLSLTSPSWSWESLDWPGKEASGVGMNFYTDGGVDKVTIVAMKKDSAIKIKTWMIGYLVTTSGRSVLDLGFGSSGNGFVDATWCDTCIPRSVAGNHTGITYIAGDFISTGFGTNRDGYVTRHGKNGARSSNWGTDGGLQTFNFNRVSGGADVVRGMAIFTRTIGGVTDTLWILSAAEDVCGTTSAGIIKIGGRRGEVDTAFGPGGKMAFGASGVPPSCFAPASIEPYDIARNGSRLAVVGRSWVRVGTTVFGRPSFNIVNSANGEVMDERRLEPTINIGNDGAGTAFHSVVPSEDDSFYAVGTAKDAESNKKSMPITARVRSDRIFGHGMED